MKRYAMRRDENEPEIVQALEAIGCTVFRLDFPCDLLVGYRAKNFLVEVKDSGKIPSKRQLTKTQEQFFKAWKGQVRKVETPEEAIRLVTEAYK